MTHSIAEKDRYSGPFGWIHRIKDWVESLAAKPYGVPALALLAFCESIFFPIPPDVLLMALCVGLPKRSLWFAFVCTVGSVAGGIFGYGIGHFLWYDAAGMFSGFAQFFFDHIPGFTTEVFEHAGALYREYDFRAVMVAGLTPVPYKVATITAGVFNLNFVVFMLASAASRALRFFLIGALFYFFGRAIKAFIDKYLEILSVLFVILLVGGFLVIRWLS
ncbi:MAG TPA: VTT domain-containing protein [Rhodothermales bacterium]|nr:VTT domain-containing protein [Rhodothermales bacterium]